MNYLSKSVRERDLLSAMLAGLAMTIASGFRYEAWLLIAVFTGMMLLLKQWKLTICFWSASMVFPLFWMIGNYIAHSDILYGLTGAYQWNIVAEGVNDNVLFFDRLKRLFYFPVSWFFFFSPFLSVWLLIKLFRRQKKQKLIKTRLIWAIPFWIVFVVFVYKAYEGTLLLQHRFSTSLIVLSVPFASIIVEDLQWTRWRKMSMIAILLSILPFSYLWMYLPFDYSFFFFKNLQKAVRDNRVNSISSFRAMPRLVDQDYNDIAKSIRSHLSSGDALILDFVSWENTYFIAFETAPSPGQVFFVDGATHGNIDEKALYKTLSKYPRGVIMLRCDSKFENLYDLKGDMMVFALKEDVALKLSPLYNKLGVGTFLYERVYNTFESDTVPCFACPEKGTVEFYILNVTNNAGQFNIDEKAFYKGVSRKEMIRLDAEWLYSENKSNE